MSAARKTVAEKLLIKPGSTVWTSELSELGRLQPLPDGVHLAERAADATTAFVFARDAASLRSLLEQHGEAVSQFLTARSNVERTLRAHLRGRRYGSAGSRLRTTRAGFP